MSRYESFAFDPYDHKAGKCWKWCKVHYFWNFEYGLHERYPADYNILSSRHGWENIVVYVGPPAYYPRKPPKDSAR